MRIGPLAQKRLLCYPESMAKKSGNFWANSIGHALAHLQDGIDDVCEWGFAKMRSVGSSRMPRKRKDENTYLYSAKRISRGVLGFLGNVGDAFHDKYAELKRSGDEE